MVWAEDLMAGRMGDEVMAAPLVGLSFQCVGVDALDEIFCRAGSFICGCAQ